MLTADLQGAAQGPAALARPAVPAGREHHGRRRPGDWIAPDRAHDQAKAIAVLDDLPALAQLRSQMRPLLQQSPLFDNRRFARNFEQAMQDLWRPRAEVPG
jgi:predicted lipid-binding transport protein (Tim44 family)